MQAVQAVMRGTILCLWLFMGWPQKFQITRADRRFESIE
jgi:hypothetical protein